jgi:hypothetical protein
MKASGESIYYVYIEPQEGIFYIFLQKDVIDITKKIIMPNILAKKKFKKSSRKWIRM